MTDITISSNSRTRTVYKGKQRIGHVWKQGNRWYHRWSEGRGHRTPESAARQLAAKIEVIAAEGRHLSSGHEWGSA